MRHHQKADTASEQSANNHLEGMTRFDQLKNGLDHNQDTASQHHVEVLQGNQKIQDRIEHAHISAIDRHSATSKLMIHRTASISQQVQDATELTKDLSRDVVASRIVVEHLNARLQKIHEIDQQPIRQLSHGLTDLQSWTAFLGMMSIKSHEYCEMSYVLACCHC